MRASRIHGALEGSIDIAFALEETWMSEVMESLAVDETILNALRNAGALRAAALLPRGGRSGVGEGLVQSRTQWCSSLGERDLQCLLQVIEGGVIPRLLNSYSPARHAPLARFESPG